jgi:DNA-binding MarR family transcriptional regulator
MEKYHIAAPPNIRAQLGQLLLQLADDVLDAVNKTLEVHHISESKLSLLLLFVAASNHPQSLQPSEIAEKLGIRRASVTKQLIWMEKHHFITRTISSEDQRMINVTITQEGYQLLDQVMPHYWQTCAELSNQLTNEETILLLTLLKKIHQTHR